MRCKCQHILRSLIRIQICLITMWKKSKADEECYLAHSGLNYMGSINVTTNKQICQNWSDDFPHKVHVSIKDEHFPDGSKAEAKNYCRNPMPDEKSGPWCYTKSKTITWDYCTICPQSNNNKTTCTLPDNGKSYKGLLSITRGGFKCDFWKSHPDRNYVFPDRSVESARNFCRNPKAASFAAPWCYTTDPAANWDYCDVCIPFRGTFIKKPGSTTTNAIRMNGMSLGRCRQWCINFMGCISVEFVASLSRCSYQPYVVTKGVTTEGADLYIINRICPKRAKNRPGYFTLYPRDKFAEHHKTRPVTIEKECDEFCILNQECQFIYTSDKNCYYTEDFSMKHSFQPSTSVKHIIRCQPDLEPVPDEEAITTSEYEEVTVEITETDIIAGSIGTLRIAAPLEGVKPKVTTARLVSGVVAVVTFVGIGSSIHGCVKTRQLSQLKKKEILKRWKRVQYLRSQKRRTADVYGRNELNMRRIRGRHTR